MPLVKIELAEGRHDKFLQMLMKATMDGVVEALKLPENDRNIRLMEYKGEHFSMKEPYKILIEIRMFKGRTIETKRSLYKAIVNKLEQELNIAKEEVFIFVNEQPKENWGVKGGLAASDLDLGFKVEI